MGSRRRIRWLWSAMAVTSASWAAIVAFQRRDAGPEACIRELSSRKPDQSVVIAGSQYRTYILHEPIKRVLDSLNGQVASCRPAIPPFRASGLFRPTVYTSRIGSYDLELWPSAVRYDSSDSRFSATVTVGGDSNLTTVVIRSSSIVTWLRTLVGA